MFFPFIFFLHPCFSFDQNVKLEGTESGAATPVVSPVEVTTILVTILMEPVFRDVTQATQRDFVSQVSNIVDSKIHRKFVKDFNILVHKIKGAKSLKNSLHYTLS